MRRRRPINADLPPVAEPSAEEKGQGPPPEQVADPPEPKRPRRPIPGALWALGAIVGLAVVFIVVAILGGQGGGKTDSSAAPTPAPAPAGEEPAAGAGESEAPEELGYPAFATDNTTRVGGSDPASNAAAVALAVFPSTAPSQRPAAVTLVGEEDWAGALAASVLMAAPVRAPVLFSTPDELPDATAEALEALDPRGSEDTGEAAYFAVGAVALPEGAGVVTRVDSGDPASTAAQIATLRDRLFGAPAAAIVVAPSSRPDLAMPAAAWAARSGDPILYSEAKKLPQPTAAALKRNPRARVYVLGPAAAISDEVVRAIAKIDGRVQRVGSEDAVANAIAFARYHDGAFGWDVNDPGHGFVLTRSDSPLNAAAAAALSGSGTWGPLLLSDDADTLPSEVRSYFLDVKPGYTNNPTRAFYNHVWVVGDQEAIDVHEQAEVNELAELARIGGEK